MAPNLPRQKVAAADAAAAIGCHALLLGEASQLADAFRPTVTLEQGWEGEVENQGKKTQRVQGQDGKEKYFTVRREPPCAAFDSSHCIASKR
jgi:hypothetical protein